MINTKRLLAITFCLLLFSTMGWTIDSAAVRAINDVEREALYPSRDMIEYGRAAAKANCAGCHGIDGISAAAGEPNLAGQRTVYLYRVLKAFQSGDRRDEQDLHNDFLNDKALISTAIYYAGLTPAKSPGNIEVPDNSQAAESEEDPFFSLRDAMRKCVKCHGETGNAGRSGMPSLTAQDPKYFVTSMMSYVDGSRSHKLMGRLVDQLDEATIRAMGVFYAVQEPVKSETRGEGDSAAGRRLSQECAGCHGEDGNTNQASMPTLAGQDAKYFVKGMQHYKNGERNHQKMFEAVEGLNEQDMIDLATFYAEQTPRRRDVRVPLRSAEWINRCERCHGIDGNSSDPRFPMLAGQDKTYLVSALESYASKVRANTTMHAMSGPLSSMDIEHIAQYFASQQPRAVVYMRLPCAENQ